jgi:two-component system cell cycle sensor histidine kinase/response regulator CckA
MQAVLGYSDILLRDLDERDTRRSDVEHIRKAAAWSARITGQLLAFSRQQVLCAEVLDIRTVINGLEPMLRQMVGRDVQLVFAQGSTPLLVKADPGQLEQVLINLVLNARHAITGPGLVVIDTDEAELGPADTERHPGLAIRAGHYVRLRVRDSGRGMDAATLARAFEPFFTTKPLGQGTGLGLATVYGVVKQSGGYVWASSVPDAGTSFEVYLPRHPASVSPGEGPGACQ